MDIVEIILFLIIAYFAGTAASNLLERGSKKGARLRNTFLGALGAFVGQILLNALDVELGEFFSNNISLGEIFVAFIGSIVTLFIANRVL